MPLFTNTGKNTWFEGYIGPYLDFRMIFQNSELKIDLKVEILTFKIMAKSCMTTPK